MGSYNGPQSSCCTSPPLPLKRSRIEPILLVLFVATAHLSTDQVNYWNEYSDTLVRYSRYIGVNRRDKCSLYSAVYQLRYVDSYRVNKSAQARAKRASSRKRRLSLGRFLAPC